MESLHISVTINLKVLYGGVKDYFLIFLAKSGKLARSTTSPLIICIIPIGAYIYEVQEDLSFC